MRNDYDSNYLEHHGILGMKWGRRNGPPYPLDSKDYSPAEKKAARAAGERAKESYKKAKNVIKSDSGSRRSKALKDARRKDIDELTTQELRDINARLREEKSYQELTKGQIAEGKRWFNDMGKTIATAVITGVMIESGKVFVKKLIS